MSKLILAVFVCFFCFAFVFFFVFFFLGGGGGVIINRQMPRGKDWCEEDKWDEKGEKKK